MPLWYDAKGGQQMGAYPNPTPGAPGLSTGSAKAFAFACRSGVSAKCYKWGYMPWLQPNPAAPNQMSEVHWACTRAARADYCGDGSSHTLQDTPVNLWDNVSPQQIKTDDVNPWVNPWGPVVIGSSKVAVAKTKPTQPNQFEGGWSIKGAVCLSHLRWNNLPNNLCADRLHTPFEDYDPIDTVMITRVCDNQGEAEQIGADAIAHGWPGIAPPRMFLESDMNAVVMPQPWTPPVVVVSGEIASFN
jgi:hypothetical protein